MAQKALLHNYPNPKKILINPHITHILFLTLLCGGTFKSLIMLSASSPFVTCTKYPVASLSFLSKYTHLHIIINPCRKAPCPLDTIKGSTLFSLEGQHFDIILYVLPYRLTGLNFPNWPALSLFKINYMKVAILSLSEPPPSHEDPSPTSSSLL